MAFAGTITICRKAVTMVMLFFIFTFFYNYVIIIIIINSFYRAQITFKSLSAFRTRIDRHMYKNTQKHEEEKYQTEKHIIKYHSLWQWKLLYKQVRFQ